MLEILPYREGPHCRVLEPWRKEYPELFAAFAATLAAGVSVEHLLEHVGSTAIPGLDAKPMLDVLMLVERALWDEALEQLAGLGVLPKETRSDLPEKPVRGCAVAWRGEEFNVNLHLSTSGSRVHRELLHFRDRLREDPDLAREYQERKHLAYQETGHKSAYNDLKWPLIQRVLAELEGGASEGPGG